MDSQDQNIRTLRLRDQAMKLLAKHEDDLYQDEHSYAKRLIVTSSKSRLDSLNERLSEATKSILGIAFNWEDVTCRWVAGDRELTGAVRLEMQCCECGFWQDGVATTGECQYCFTINNTN